MNINKYKRYEMYVARRVTFIILIRENQKSTQNILVPQRYVYIRNNLLKPNYQRKYL